ncbi:hypothetical protein POPA111323_03045 [Polynucleobacter paneuropaeus]|jgi:hypothetical protein
MNTSFSTWLLRGITLVLLALVFISYYRPELMLNITNQLWALCS